MSASPEQINRLFAQKIDTAEGKEKLAAYGGSYVRDRLREVSFVRKILPPQYVTAKDCQVSVNHDTLVKIVEVEPKTRAMVMDFRSQPDVNFFSMKRAECSFFTISSEMYQKTEQELMTYTSPITKIIEENSVKDIQEIEDREFLLHVEAACQALQAEANGGTPVALSASELNDGTPPVEFSIIKGELARNATADDAVVRPLQRKDIVNLFKLVDGNRLRCERLLMTEVDFDDVLQWTVEDNGDKIQSETTVDGYKYNTLLGRPYIRTIKTDILRPGNIYGFAAPDFFGKMFVLNQPKFYIDKVANRITFQAWEDIGMVVVNIAAVRKLELYSADANPTTNATGLLASFIPKSEDDLGAVNNRVEQGLKFPKVVQY